MLTPSKKTNLVYQVTNTFLLKATLCGFFTDLTQSFRFVKGNRFCYSGNGNARWLKCVFRNYVNVKKVTVPASTQIKI